MFASFSSLPVELLNEIVSEDCLSRRDIINLSCACKSISAIVKSYIPVGKVIFDDLMNDKPFYFLKRLLNDPSFGDGFTALKIDWNYSNRNQDQSDERGPEYKAPISWTENERSKLKQIARKYNYHDFWRNAIENQNSPDSFLLPTFALLKNLEMLELIEPHCYGLVGVQYTDCGETHLVDMIQRLTLGTSLYIKKPEKLLAEFPPGLLSLKHFVRTFAGDEYGFDIDSIIPILLLPNLESITCDLFGVDFSSLESFADMGMKCPVKKVHFSRLGCVSEDVVRFLEFCDRLEDVDIMLEDTGMDVFSGDPEDDFDLRPMVQVLMSRHQGTLKKASLRAGNNYWFWKKTVQKVEIEEKLE